MHTTPLGTHRPGRSAPFWLALRALCLCVAVALSPTFAGCKPVEVPLAPKDQTWAELRVVRRGVTVVHPGEPERTPFPRERLPDGAVVKVVEGGLAWLRRDAGATVLVRGPAELVAKPDVFELRAGRVFVDTPAKVTAEIGTPNGPLHLAGVRASLEVADQKTRVHVLSGEVRAAGDVRALAGEELALEGAPGPNGEKGSTKGQTKATLAWEDWTGGLATTDRGAEPAPFGIGTVGARRPSDVGTPRFSLSIQRLDVNVRVDGDLAITEVEQEFFNPSSNRVEGIYRFRTPQGASIQRFGVDRKGVIAWGYVKEKAAARATYESHVYEGSKEDPALLEWEAPGVYRARLYPIEPGETRRVVVRYTEWLARTGRKGERRLFVYPMAAEGSEASLPFIEELNVELDLSKSGAKEVRAGMKAARIGDGKTLVVRAHDVIPRADLAVELFDDGRTKPKAIVARHDPDSEVLAPEERRDAAKRASGEAEYLLVPLGVRELPTEQDGLDLAIVVDTSAGTDLASLSLSRAATAALLSHLGPKDRVAVYTGDVSLTALSGDLGKTDDARKLEILSRLAEVVPSGATDLGAMLADAAQKLDPARRGAVVYVGDGRATVGERTLGTLRERLAKLPRAVRIFSLGVGEGANMQLLSGVATAAFAERVTDGHAAARAVLRLLETAERPALLDLKIDLGPTVERVSPRSLGALVADESLIVVGRLKGQPPTAVRIDGPSGPKAVDLEIARMTDEGDLRRRWAEGRLAELLEEGAGHAALVDLGVRQGIITPVTSLYVPTWDEMSADDRRRLQRQRNDEAGKKDKAKKETARSRDDDDRDGDREEERPQSVADNKEGGTGTRAKGEEGVMGRSSGGKRDARPSATAAAAAAPAPSAGPVERPSEAPPAPPRDAEVAPLASAGSWGSDPVAGALVPGQSAGEGIGLGDIGVIGHGGGSGSGQGYGTGTGRLDGSPKGGNLEEKSKLRAQGKPPASEPVGDVPKQPDPDRGLNAKKVTDKGGDETKNEHAGRPAVEPARVAIVVRSGDAPVFRVVCSDVASLPLAERVPIWRERLSGNAPQGVALQYRRALGLCELPTFRERAAFLSLGLDVLGTVPLRVTLWRIMRRDLGASDFLYRGILARIRTADELRALHQALGLRFIDSPTLKQLLAEQKTPGDRAKKLRELVQAWPDDLALHVRLLESLEDADDDGAALELGRKLRARPDADAWVRTVVGELHLRLAARAKSDADKKARTEDARRVFGEIVEFAPDDPVARRRLGDLLRAHGWFADAARQYETLRALTPDDPGVLLLLAACSNGLGKLEEAVLAAEKAAQSSSYDVDTSPARTAIALASSFLAWGRLEAREKSDKDSLAKLVIRQKRLPQLPQAKDGSKGMRVTLLWSHPELHPALWSNALGAPMPASEGDPLLGVTQVILPAKEASFVEVRLEPDEVERAARLGAEVIVTVVVDEGLATERVFRTKVTFTRDVAAGKGGPNVIRVNKLSTGPELAPQPIVVEVKK